MAKKYVCPRCGKSNHSTQNQGGSQTTFLHCKGCGFKAAERAWKIQQGDLSKLSQNNSVGSDSKMASDKPSAQNDPKHNPFFDRNEKSRNKKKRPTDKFKNKGDDEVRMVSSNNPFLKTSVSIRNEFFDIPAQQDWKGLYLAVHEAENNANHKSTEGKTPQQLLMECERFRNYKRHDGSNPFSDSVIDLEHRINNLIESGPVAIEHFTSVYNPFLKVSNKNEGLEQNNQEANKMASNGRCEMNPFIKKSKKFDGPKGPKDSVPSKDKKKNQGKQPKALEGPTGPEGPKGPKKASFNPFVKSAKITAPSNPFMKQAREFDDRSEHGKVMKQLSDHNMVYPEMPIGSNVKSPDGKKEKDKTSTNDKSDLKTPLLNNSDSNKNLSYDFNTVDRKENRSSPKAQDFDPGYKDWYDREIDKYYDGWLDDHIENAGGSVPGSNNQKTMNLDKGERAHAPVFPVEAVYEKLLENRHQFDGDYTRIVANGQNFLLKKADVEEILKVGGTLQQEMSLAKEAATILINRGIELGFEKLVPLAMEAITHFSKKIANFASSTNPEDLANKVVEMVSDSKVKDPAPIKQPIDLNDSLDQSGVDTQFHENNNLQLTAKSDGKKKVLEAGKKLKSVLHTIPT